MSEIKVGSKVTVNGKPQLGAATVRFYGQTQFQEGLWVGLELNTAEGKNDGSVQSVRYFSCPPNHGLFIRENQVTLVSEETKEPPAKPVKEAAIPPVKETKKETPSKKDAREPSKKTPSKEAASKGIKAAKSLSGGKVSTSPVKKAPSNPGSASGSTSTTPRKGSPTTADRKAALVDKTEKSDSSSQSSPRDGASTDDEPRESPRVREVAIPQDSPRETTPSIESPREAPKEAPKESPKEAPKEISRLLAPTPQPIQSQTSTGSAENVSLSTSSADLTAAVSQASPMRNESIEKLMRALKELNDFKVKAQGRAYFPSRIMRRNNSRTSISTQGSYNSTREVAKR